MSNLDHLEVLDRYCSMLRHPASDKTNTLEEISAWFNSLKPDEKLEAFQFLLGKVLHGG